MPNWNKRRETNSSLKFLRFSFSRFQRLLRADSFGGAAGGGAAPEQASPAVAGRANTLKFDIFCKRPAVRLVARKTRDSLTAIAILR